MVEPIHRQEAERLIAMYGEAFRAFDVVRQQFAVLQQRSQLLLTLATITLTITGFSGPKMVQSGPFTRWAMVIGLALVLGAVVLLLSSLRVKWLSQFDAGSPAATLAEGIAYRDSKTKRFQHEVVLLIAGITSYVAAVIAYLLS